VLVVVALFTAFLTATAHLSTERNRRIVCANNLRQIGMGALMYARSQGISGTYWSHVESFPRTRYDESNPTPTAYTGADSNLSFSDDNYVPPSSSAPYLAPRANDVSASLFLIFRTQMIRPDPFVCPGSDGEPYQGGPYEHANFPSRQYLGYSYSNPFPTAAALKVGWRFDDNVAADSPLAADMNPGFGATKVSPKSSPSEMSAGNSINHDGTGQNVLYIDGHTEFQTTPFCGRQRPDGYRDNIYTFGDSSSRPAMGIEGPPQDAYDAVLLPTMDDGPQPPKRPWTQKLDGTDLLTFAGEGVSALVAIVMAIRVLIARRRRRTSRLRTLPRVTPLPPALP